MQIENVTPELAERFFTAHAEATNPKIVDGGVGIKISWGLYALSALPEARENAARSHSFKDAQRVRVLEKWLADSEPHLSEFLKPF